MTALAVALALPLAACGCAAASEPAAETTAEARHLPRDPITISPPDWARDAVIYEINLRQFTPEGTLAAATSQLPRLQALGVDILWLMPIHPIGERNRKGSLGSPYSVRDYRAVNPEFGAMADLRRFVDRAHELGMRVILDWVANHSSWDNPLVAQHPDWYERDWRGRLHPTSWSDWSDIVEFDYSRQELREYMADSMAFWVREAGVDGFRCDVAGYVPLDFWEQVRGELQRIKPVFMLAESDSRDMHYAAFDATYAWSLYSALHDVMGKGASVDAIAGHYAAQDNLFPRGSMRMTFTSNHDENAWRGSEFESFGPGVEAAIVLTFVGDGIPLIYNGQEAGNPRRLSFFERDPIAWRSHPHAELFSRLARLKSEISALHNGRWGARMIPVANDSPRQVLSFMRSDARSKVLALFNFSGDARRVRLADSLAHGTYRDFLTGARTTVTADASVELAPWGWAVLVER